MNCFIEVFHQVNKRGFDPQNYGVLDNKKQLINGEMYFYKSSDLCFKSFAVLYLNKIKNNVTLVLTEKISLKELEKMFGDYTSAYNFRDNTTNIYFLNYSQYNEVESIQVEFIGNSINTAIDIEKVILKFKN